LTISIVTTLTTLFFSALTVHLLITHFALHARNPPTVRSLQLVGPALWRRKQESSAVADKFARRGV